MEVPWSQLREEANALAAEIGRSGRQHHSMLKDGAVLAAVRARGVPPEHRDWAWPMLLHEQVGPDRLIDRMSVVATGRMD